MLLALPSTSALVARTLLSVPEVESVPAVPILVLLVMELVLVLHVSVVSSTSRELVRLHAPMVLDLSTECVNVSPALFLWVSV